MTLGIIELNDAGIRIGDEQKIHAESIGVAVLQEKQSLFGEPALRQQRLQPLNAFTQFWHRLNADPLSTKNPLFRHHADLGYSHLVQLHSAMPDCDQIIFALPGSFSREQMSLLLGIVGQCEFKAVGLIDAALAASINYVNTQRTVHVDIQLHQAIISVLEFETQLSQPAKLQRTLVDVVPHAGWVAIHDTLARGIAEHFLDQTRFDPLHSAATEQSLYDLLPQWLSAINTDRETVMAVGATTIKLSQESILRILKPIFTNILNKVSQHIGGRSNDPNYSNSNNSSSNNAKNNTQLLISDRLHRLPGFIHEANALTDNITLLPNNAVNQGIAAQQEYIRGKDAQLNFVQSVPLDSFSGKAIAFPQSQQKQVRTHAITHCLIDSIAYSLTDSTLFIDKETSGVTSSASPSSLCALTHTSGKVTIAPINGNKVQVNGSSIADNLEVSISDHIELANNLKLQLIEVRK